MQNLYQVDPTGKAYTLDVNPMIAADNKRAAGQIASIQAMGKVADEGFKAVENYQARKQLANLATSVQNLKPGTPEFEQQVASLVFQNPLAFNNPNTANTAKAGLAAMGSAHAEAMKTKYQDRQNEFTLRRDQANFDNRLDVAKERYNAKKGSPLDVNAALHAIENGEDPSASVEAAPPSEGSYNSNAESGSVDPPLPEPGNQNPVENRLIAPVDGAPDETLPPDGGPLPAPGDSGPVGEEGGKGGKGPSGVEGMPAAAGVVKVPATAKAPMTKGVTTSVDEQVIELHAKAANAENLASILKSRDQDADALVASAQANKYKLLAKKLEISPEAQAEKRAAALANQKELDTAKVAEDAPVIAEALSTQYSGLPEGWMKEMQEDFKNVKNLSSLTVKKEAWSSMMANATQAAVRGETIPEKPSDYKKLSIKESTYRTVANELRAAENDLIKIHVPKEGGNKADAEKAIVAKRAEIEGLKAKADKAGKDVMDFKKEIGLIKPDPVVEAPPAKELSPYEKALSEIKPDEAPTRTNLEKAKVNIAEMYPSVLADLAKIAADKSGNDKDAIKKALSKAHWGGETIITPMGFGSVHDYETVAAAERLGVDPEEAAREIIADIRARKNEVKGGKAPSGNVFEAIK